MGQTLLWIELLIASCLMATVAIVDGARGKQTWLRWTVIASGVLFPLGCWASVTYIAIWLRMGGVGPVSRPLFLATLAGIFLIVTIVVFRRGLRNRRAALWPARKLNLVFAAACVLSLMTFWNLDLNAKNQLGHLRARAGSIVAATFPPRIPDSRNAARVYEQAFESLEMMTSSRTIAWAPQVSNWLNSPREASSTTRPADAGVRKILETNSLGLKQLRRATQMEECNFVGYWDWTDLVNTLLNHISNVRTASELLAADARMRAIDGDITGSIADLNAMFAMSEHMTREPTIVTALAAMMTEDRAVETLEIILSGSNVSAADLTSLKIDPLFSHGRLVRSALRGEEAMVLSILSSLGDPGYHPLSDHYLPELMIPMFRVFLMGDEIREYNTAMTEWQRLAAIPYHQAREQWISLPKRLAKHQTGFLTARMLPAVSVYPDRAAEGDARRRLSRLAVAMTSWRIKTGALPESLDKLAPEFIEMIPADPFDGKPLRMIVNKDGGAILYSVGPDLKDDSGAAMDNQNRTGDIRFRIGAK